MKTCYMCGLSLEEHLFYPDTHSNNGTTSACIECQKKRSKDYYSKVKNQLTDEQKRLRKEAYIKWKLMNPERFKQLTEKHNSKRK